MIDFKKMKFDESWEDEEKGLTNIVFCFPKEEAEKVVRDKCSASYDATYAELLLTSYWGKMETECTLTLLHGIERDGEIEIIYVDDLALGEDYTADDVDYLVRLYSECCRKGL